MGKEALRGWRSSWGLTCFPATEGTWGREEGIIGFSTSAPLMFRLGNSRCGGCPVCGRMLSSLSGLYPLDASSSSPHLWQPNESRHASVCPCGKVNPVGKLWCNGRNWNTPRAAKPSSSRTGLSLTHNSASLQLSRPFLPTSLCWWPRFLCLGENSSNQKRASSFSHGHACLLPASMQMHGTHMQTSPCYAVWVPGSIRQLLPGDRAIPFPGDWWLSLSCVIFCADVQMNFS